MSLFSALSISGTGVDAMQSWIDTSAGNIANSDDQTSPTEGTYAEQSTIFSPAPQDSSGIDQGVQSTIQEGSTTGQLVQDPGSPLANSQGYIREPDISLSDQLVGMMQAQEGYQANTDAMSKAISAYQSGLTIGS